MQIKPSTSRLDLVHFLDSGCQLFVLAGSIRSLWDLGRVHYINFVALEPLLHDFCSVERGLVLLEVFAL